VIGVSPVIALNPHMPWSFELPSPLKMAIADAVTLFSKIDSCILETVWLVEGADLARKKKLAKAFASDNVEAIEAIVKSIPGAKTDAIWPALKELRNDRNLIVHGVWMVDDQGRPLVLWHSKMLDSDEHVTAEYFEYRRFDRFLQHGAVLLKTFAELKRLLEQAIAEEVAARQTSDGT
jgi:hypothetical protein